MKADLHGIDTLGIERVLKRGTGERFLEEEGALLVRDSVSGAWFLACEDQKTARAPVIAIF